MVSTSGLHIWRPHIFGVVWPPPGPQNLYCLSANLLHFLSPSPFSADVIHGSPFVRARYTSRSNLRILSRSSCREKWHWQAVMYAGAYPLLRKSHCTFSQPSAQITIHPLQGKLSVFVGRLCALLIRFGTSFYDDVSLGLDLGQFVENRDSMI